MNEIKRIASKFYLILCIFVNTFITHFFSSGPILKSWDFILHLSVNMGRTLLADFETPLEKQREHMELFLNYLPYGYNKEVLKVPDYYRNLGKNIVKSYLKNSNCVYHFEEEPNLPPLEIEWLYKKIHVSTNRAILFLHGGGFFLGSSTTHRMLNLKLIEKTGAEMFCPNYRLAPEHPFPAALIDCIATYIYILDHFPKFNNGVFLSGDSAGGNISINLLYLLKEPKYLSPVGCLLFSPWLDVSMENPSCYLNAKYDCLPHIDMHGEQWLHHFSEGLMKICDKKTAEGIKNRGHYYCKEKYIGYKLISPIHEQTGDAERIRDDSVLFANKVHKYYKDKNIKEGLIRLELYEEMPHCFVSIPFVELGSLALSRGVEFINSCFDGDISSYSEKNKTIWKSDVNGKLTSIET